MPDSVIKEERKKINMFTCRGEIYGRVNDGKLKKVENNASSPVI